VLERAFLKTYGLDVNELFGNFSRTVGTFRWIVKSFFPTITKAAWSTMSDEIKKTVPNATSRRFIYQMHHKNYKREFGNEKPRFLVQVLSVFIQALPKIGPLRVLKFKMPDTDAENVFIKSFDTAVSHYRSNIILLRNGNIALSNIDFDTGKETVPAEYGLADKSYAEWLLKLQRKNFETTTPAIKENILDFYGDNKPASLTRQNSMQALEQLKTTVIHQ
jgi:hypothetical protein